MLLVYNVKEGLPLWQPFFRYLEIQSFHLHNLKYPTSSVR